MEPVPRSTAQDESAAVDVSRPWAVTALSVLLLIETLGLVAIALLILYNPDYRWELSTGRLVFRFTVGFQAGFFLTIALLTSGTALGFFRLRPTAWVYAMGFQAIILAVALALYFNSRPVYVYPMMVYGIFMVIYLNYPDVQQAFQTT